MSKPTNSAARNQMTKWERQCYDWGWEDAEERIIKLLEEQLAAHTLPNGTVYIEFEVISDLIAEIKGEQK